MSTIETSGSVRTADANAAEEEHCAHNYHPLPVVISLR